MRVVSWNVNGIRSAEKALIAFLNEYQPEILLLQELRAHPNDLSFFLKMIDGYRVEFNPADRPGYSGTAVYYRNNLDCQIKTDFDQAILSEEGRGMRLDASDICLLNFYVPNGNSSNQRLQYKLDYIKAVKEVAEEIINQGKPVVIGADMNIGHTEKDTYRPETAKNSSGFLPVERNLFGQLLETGLADVFRLFEKEGGHYTWWSFDDKERIKNHGWRFDYFLASKNLIPKIGDSKILSDVFGSDHCPILLELEI